MATTGQVLPRSRNFNLNWRKVNSWFVYGGNFVMAILFLAPWVWALAVSFLPTDLLFNFPPVLFHWPPSLDMYKMILEVDNYRFLNSMRFSAIIAASTSVCVVMLSGLAGYAFARLNFRGKNFLFVLILATMMFPFTAVLMPLFSLISSLKLLNNPISLSDNGTYFVVSSNNYTST